MAEVFGKEVSAKLHLESVDDALDVVVSTGESIVMTGIIDDHILRVIEGLQSQLSGDLLAEDLRLALDTLAEITGGQITPNEVLGNIFTHFCVGK